MRYRVLKTFQTPNHRLVEGAIIGAADIDGPLTAADWMQRGYLEETNDQPALVVPPPAGNTSDEE